MRRFEGQTVIVTGGSRGMGASHARGFVDEGARVVIADILEDEGRALATELGDRALFVRLDVTNEDDWANAINAAEDAFGPVSVLVNNAGIAYIEPLGQTKPDAWRKVIDVNLTGQFLGIRAVVPSMRRAGGGAIVNISSMMGLSGFAGFSAYGASKWGVRGLTKYAALELGRDGIRVNSIHPGAVNTEMASSLEGISTETNPIPRTETIPIPRIAEPEEITRLVLFVASGDAAYSTGSEFIAEGGALLGQAPQAELAKAHAA